MLRRVICAIVILLCYPLTLSLTLKCKRLLESAAPELTKQQHYGGALDMSVNEKILGSEA